MSRTRMPGSIGVVAVATIFVGWLAVARPVSAGKSISADRPAELSQADQKYDQQNFKDAIEAYRRFAVGQHPANWLFHSRVRMLFSHLRMGQYDEATAAADETIKRFAGTVFEARAQWVAGNLFLILPHNGVEKGGKYVRGRWGDGKPKDSHASDRRIAILHLERSRDLLIGISSDQQRLKALEGADREGLPKERVETQFDLVAALTRFTPYDENWHNWWYAWNATEHDPEDTTVGEESDQEAGERPFHRGFGGRSMGRPRGIPVDPQGQPIFEPLPRQYASGLPDGQKIKYLLDEIAKFDPSENQDDAALALYRKAMLARTRYGPHRLQRLGQWWEGGGNPYRDQVRTLQLWDLADDEVVTLVGTRLAKLRLPEDEDILGLLRSVSKRYPKSRSAPTAQFAMGLYYQSRNQLKEAVREYERLRHDFPGSPHEGAARSLVEAIERPEARIGEVGVQMVGVGAEFPLSHKNTGKVHFTAYPVDLWRFIQDSLERVKKDGEDKTGEIYGALHNPLHNLLFNQRNGRHRYEEYKGALVAEWDSTVNDDRSHRTTSTKMTSPLKERGCYLVEAQIAGHPEVSRNLVLIQDLALVEKKLKDKNLFWTVNPRTGEPIGGAELTHVSVWSKWERRGIEWKERPHWYTDSATTRSDKDGVSLFGTQPREGFGCPQILTIAKTANGAMAFHGIQYWSHYYNPTSQWSGQRGAVFTDRPVYRPDQPVRFKVWVRAFSDGKYQTPPEGTVRAVEIRDPKGNVVYSKPLALDSFGGAGDQFRLAKGCPLGMYRVELAGVDVAGARFRVEEYKKPEFEVMVETGTNLARLGDRIEGKVKARYYFGAPVTEARVTYRIYRQEYTHRYTSPGSWDWLYGWGYGRCFYDYDWFPWWRLTGPKCWTWCSWWGPEPKPERELVTEGAGDIGADGTFAFVVDTKPALSNHPDLDHQYSIEAEVVDKSRRTITGSGAIKVTRQEFYVFLEADRGYYTPGQQIACKVKAITANDTAVSVPGKITVSQVSYRSEGGSEIVEKPEKTFEARTDPEGNLTFTLKADRSGQFKVAFETTDSRKRPVIGTALIWVLGQDFQGSIHRFRDLEIITDQRTYKPGEVARLMVNCDTPGASVLLSTRPDGSVLTNYRLVVLSKKSTIVEVPIEAGDQPNFFVEATTVTGGQVRQEMREILVPPENGVMDVRVESDKSEYKPGEKATLKVKTTTSDGKPVRAEVALSAFDRSVLYVQPELTPDLRTHFWGRKRTHGFLMASTLSFRMAGTGNFGDVSQMIHGYAPQDWHGSWGSHGLAFWGASDESLVNAVGGGMTRGHMKAARMRSRVADGAIREEGAVDKEKSLGFATSAKGNSFLADRDEIETKGGRARKDQKPGEAAAEDPGQAPFVAARFRSEFEDTAHWVPDLITNPNGEATTTFTFPENLTTWRIRALAMAADTRVGDGAASAVTTKKFVLRLQTPRFFVERDRVLLSVNLHNYLKTDKKSKVTLGVTHGFLEIVGAVTQEVVVKAGGEARVDWEVAVRKEGLATVEAEALTDEESDAVRMAFPVLVHGIEKTVSKTGLMRRTGPDRVELDLDVPADRKPEASRLEVRFSPTLAGAMVDAIPYLIDYPYGCTEQTMSRFLPAVLVQKSLITMGISLEDLRKSHTNLNSEQTGAADPAARNPRPMGVEPVFDPEKLKDVVRSGLDRLYRFQNRGGGWGWWANDTDSPFLTAYVCWGLALAQENDVAIDQRALSRGFASLRRGVGQEIKDWEKSSGAFNEQAFLAYVLSLRKEQEPALTDLLFERRAHLSLYGKALLSLALRTLGRIDRADLVLSNIRQYEKQDAENQTAWYEAPTDHFWSWWNNDIEAHAWILRAVLAKNPKDEKAPWLVKWLLNNRRNGTYWRSTRDTAISVATLVDYMKLTGEDVPDFTLKVLYDDKVMKEVKIDRSRILSFDNRFSLSGDLLTSGRHVLRFERQGKGALYFSTSLSYFTKEEGIAPAGLEVKVDRTYYRLERKDKNVTVQGARLQDVSERRVRYERVLLKTGDVLTSGDLIEVELKLTAKNDYDYLVIEDPKPAGCEPVELVSGARFGELCSNMELRDDKVAFFVTWLSQGEHLVKYRLRAEIPGTFHALPTHGYAMYAPEIRANAAEQLIGIRDRTDIPGR